MKCGVSVLFVLCAALGLSPAQAAVRQEIKPTLSPKEDHHFFGPPFPADYPDDGRPAVAISKHFDHPYPIVQDSNTFENDYVKDENNDNGEWAAQFAYDKLRGQVRMKRAEVDRALKRKTDEEKDYSKKKADAQDAENKYNKVKETEDKAKKEHDEAEKKKEEIAAKEKDAEKKEEAAAKAAADADAEADAAEAEEAAGGTEGAAAAGVDGKKLSMSDKVAAAEQDVKDKIKHLEGCKQELEDAKNQLKETLEKQKAMEEEAKKNKKLKEKELAADKDAAAAQKAKAAALLKDAASAEDAAKASLGDAEKEADAERAAKEEAQRKLDEEEQRRARANMRYEEQVHDYEATEAELKAAEAKVKALREGVDMGGGIVRKTTPLPPLSGAPAMATSKWLAALVVAVSYAAAC